MNRNLIKSLLAIAITAAFASTASAAVMEYTNETDFLNALGGSFYRNDFDDITAPLASSETFSGNGIEYSISANSSNLWLLDNKGIDGSHAITITNPNDSITISIEGGVYAIGGYFWSIDGNDNFASSSVTINLSTGDSYTFTPSTLQESFYGFISDDGMISSLSLSGYSGRAPTLDNVTVSLSVPEPSTWALVSLSLVGGLFFVARKPPRGRAITSVCKS